jgi:uncharacterized membrane protein HdeD (DUF308 family)
MAKPLTVTTAEHRPGSRKWSLQLGAALVLLGGLALVATGMRVAGKEMLFAWLIMLSGITEFVHAIYLRKTAGFFLHLIPAIAAAPASLLFDSRISQRPQAQAVVWAAVFASYFLVIGLFRTISAARIRFSRWRWAALDGSLTTILGILLWASWPRLELQPSLLGYALGVSLVLRGWSMIMFAVGNRDSEKSRDIRLHAA